MSSGSSLYVSEILCGNNANTETWGFNLTGTTSLFGQEAATPHILIGEVFAHPDRNKQHILGISDHHDENSYLSQCRKTKKKKRILLLLLTSIIMRHSNMQLVASVAKQSMASLCLQTEVHSISKTNVQGRPSVCGMRGIYPHSRSINTQLNLTPLSLHGSVVVI